MSRFGASVFFSGGFRPFFLGAGLLALFYVPLWLASFSGYPGIPVPDFTLDWHIHEMIFGYFGAVVAGFLLTAIPNWTGRPALSGLPLGLLVALWLAGRVVMALPGHALELLIDGAFLVIMTAVALREVWHGRNWRNMPVVIFVGLYAASNILFHLEQQQVLSTAFSFRAGISVLVLLIALIGGRIIPNFSLNWLKQQDLPATIAPFGTYDKLTLAATALALILWTMGVFTTVTGLLLVSAGLLQGYRLLRWRTWSIRQNALLLILHAAYAWLPAGFLLLGADLLGVAIPLGQSAGIHALTVGLMTMMTLAVMSRAILGHTGRPLQAGVAGSLLFGLILLAALLRLLAPLAPYFYQPLLVGSVLAWSAAFLVFLIHFGRLTLLPRADHKP